MLRDQIIQDFIDGYYSKRYSIHDEFCIVTREFSVDVDVFVRHDDMYGLIPKYASSKAFYMDDVIIDAISWIEALIKVKENGNEFTDHVKIYVYRPTDGEVYATVKINDVVTFKIGRHELRHLLIPLLHSDVKGFVEILDDYKQFPIWPVDIAVLWNEGCETWVREWLKDDGIICKELLRESEGDFEELIAAIVDQNGDNRYYIVDINRYGDKLEADVWVANKKARWIKAKLEQ